ncbi:MAG: polyphosphate polymerase domain-containing protein [Lachnospiraceae bacterium]|nr:polyphosphate polymerase domain-containing protein [Lachnospiraceae bacterium]
MEYRVEDKYIITEDKAVYIEAMLKEVCEPDAHGVDGRYNIRSVYFDDMYDTCLRENEAGTDNREKYRIRSYDLDDKLIHLELKSKLRGYTHKDAVTLSKREALRLIDRDDRLWSDIESDPENNREIYLIKKLCAEMQYRRMQPVVLIEYERTAYTYTVGNVRITFDRSIGASKNYYSLWDKNALMIPVMPTGQLILEIKYDELLPDHIRQIVDIGSLNKTAYSKYYYGRMSI